MLFIVIKINDNNEEDSVFVGICKKYRKVSIVERGTWRDLNKLKRDIICLGHKSNTKTWSRQRHRQQDKIASQR
jgi:hypothetical protein